MTRKPPPSSPGLPSQDALRKFLLSSPDPLDKDKIAKAFGVKGQDVTRLRILLREMEEGGALKKDPHRNYTPSDVLPENCLIEITGLDGDGELRARPADWKGKGPAPVIFVLDPKRGDLLDPGARVLARVKRISRLEYEAKILKKHELPGGRVVGVFKPARDGGWIYPADRKVKDDLFIPAEEAEGLADGDLVVAELSEGRSPQGKAKGRILQKLGKKDDPRLISLIAIHTHGIPVDFPKDAVEQAEAAKEPGLEKGRVDIRRLPLVTIDGADARDFDDAVFAEPWENNGWHLIVAIADVSHYVTPGSALDRTAFERGNSTYFADRVVPMLPERLSNDLCSLRPHVDRACLAVHLWVDSNGKLVRHEFFRGLMRSAARLTYEQAEDAHKGYPDDTTGPLIDPVIRPLYKAYALLRRARELRGALDIDLPERKAVIGPDGKIAAIIPRERLQSHMLVEEFMILANVAAAEALEKKPCLYRVHAPPAAEKLETTRDFLKEFGYSLPASDRIRPADINRILKLSAEKADKALVHTVLLRTQSQASYSPANLGHFGLALTDYAHFTSPIRRYADLVVHRSLVATFGLGGGGITAKESEELTGIGEHISFTERRSMLAERDVMDRFTALYLSANIGREFKGRVSGVTRFGLFITLDDTGADGIVPIRTLPQDFYIHDEKRHALVGKRTGITYRLAEEVVVRLKEADPLRGSTVFELLDGERERPARPGGDKKKHRGRRRR